MISLQSSSPRPGRTDRVANLSARDHPQTPRSLQTSSADHEEKSSRNPPSPDLFPFARPLRRRARHLPPRLTTGRKHGTQHNDPASASVCINETICADSTARRAVCRPPVRGPARRNSPSAVSRNRGLPQIRSWGGPHLILRSADQHSGRPSGFTGFPDSQLRSTSR